VAAGPRHSARGSDQRHRDQARVAARVAGETCSSSWRSWPARRSAYVDARPDPRRAARSSPCDRRRHRVLVPRSVQRLQAVNRFDAYLYRSTRWRPGMAGIAVNARIRARYRLAARRDPRRRDVDLARDRGLPRSRKHCARQLERALETERMSNTPRSTFSTARSTPATRTRPTSGCGATRPSTSTQRTTCGAWPATPRCWAPRRTRRRSPARVASAPTRVPSR
jgi:hypothetical protein